MTELICRIDRYERAASWWPLSLNRKLVVEDVMST